MFNGLWYSLFGHVLQHFRWEDTKPLLVLVSKGNASSQQRCGHQQGDRYAFMGSVTSWDTWFSPSQRKVKQWHATVSLTASEDSCWPKKLAVPLYKDPFLNQLHPKGSWMGTYTLKQRRATQALCCHPKTSRESVPEQRLSQGDSRPMTTCWRSNPNLPSRLLLTDVWVAVSSTPLEALTVWPTTAAMAGGGISTFGVYKAWHFWKPCSWGHILISASAGLGKGNAIFAGRNFFFFTKNFTGPQDFT